MKTTCRARWEREVVALQRVLAELPLREETKWGQPTFTVDGKNIVIIQCFKEWCGLGFFQGALLKDPRNVLVQLGQVQAGRVMKFTAAKDIDAQATTIARHVREAILTPGRQRGYLYHFASAKQSSTRAARIEKAMPAIFNGRGFQERR